MPKLVTVIGPPGAGKTTVGKAVGAIYNLTHLSGGDVARQLAVSDDETRERLEVGKLAPRQKMNDAMLSYLNSGGDLILDGFPRYFEQLLDVQLFRPEHTLHIVLNVDADTAYDRLTNRSRSDDRPAQIAHRIQTFNYETMPMIMWLQRRQPRRVVNIDAQQPLRRVIDSVSDAMDSWLGIIDTLPGQKVDY